MGADTVRATQGLPVTLDEAEEILRAIEAEQRAGVRGPTVSISWPFERYSEALATHWARKGEV